MTLTAHNGVLAVIFGDARSTAHPVAEMNGSYEPPRMYREIADWFHLITSPAEYAVEADYYRSLLLEASEIPIRTVLELGSGGGNNASHLKAHFELTLADLSEEMLTLSEQLNPECEHLQGDMRTLRLSREFDAVFIHDAISYITTEQDVRATIVTAFDHCKPGGAALFAPDAVAETFEPYTDHGGHDGDGRSVRYLEWVIDEERSDTTYVVNFAYLLRDETGMRVEQDRHLCGLFPRTTWMDAIEAAGFRAERHPGREQETAEDIFVGVKPR